VRYSETFVVEKHGHDTDTEAEMANLTQTFCKRVLPPPAGNRIHYDGGLRGFATEEISAVLVDED